MNWLDVIWVVMAAACLTLGAIHFLIWAKQPGEKANLSFTITAVALAAAGVIELQLMHARSAQEFAELVRWLHVPVLAMVVGLVLFVRLHLRAGRPWLGYMGLGLRAFTLIPNFLSEWNVNWRDVHELVDVEIWGGAHFKRVDAELSIWMPLVQLSNYLLIAFFIDASVTAWRDRGNPGNAKVLRICASIALFLMFAVFWQLAILLQVVVLPVTILPAFIGVLLVMSYELGGDVTRATQIAKDLNTVKGTLRRSEQRIEDAVQAAGFGLWEWDRGDGELWLSPRGRDLLDLPAGMPFDRHRFLACIDPEDRQALDAAMASALSSSGAFACEYRYHLADGSHRWLLARGQAEAGGSGQPERLRGVLLDISERKQADESFRKLVRMEREAAVQRDELAHLSRVVLLAELSGSLAHELNQPLTSILSNAQAAQRYMQHDPPNLGEVSESLANIVESDKRAGEVIRRLRAMLRKEPAEFRRLDMNEVVQDVLRMMDADLLARDVTVRLDLQVDLPASDGDSIQLQQVLLNLLVNGSDAMRDMATRRELTVRTHTANDGGVEVTVSDRGPGIPPDDLERVFSPFVTSKRDGMGLGLAVCKTIIEAHHGRLWASNNTDAGASLHFWLPPKVRK